MIAFPFEFEPFWELNGYCFKGMNDLERRCILKDIGENKQND